MRKLVYTNPNNVSFTFDDSLFGITKLTGLGSPDLNIQEQKAPFQDGSTNIDELYNPREVICEGIIAVGHDLLKRYQYRRQMCAAVNAKLGPGTLRYYNDYGTWDLRNVIPEGPIFGNKNANEGNQDVQITFYCHDPFFYDLIQQNLSLQTVINELIFPVTFVSGGIVFSSYVGGAKSLYNEGDYNTPVVVDIYGPCTNPKLIKTSTGEYIKINKTMVAGDMVEINTTMGNKTVYYTASGGSAVNAINLLDLGSTFFSLDIGHNAVQLTDDASSSAKLCFVKWYNRYVGV